MMESSGQQLSNQPINQATIINITNLANAMRDGGSIIVHNPQPVVAPKVVVLENKKKPNASSKQTTFIVWNYFIKNLNYNNLIALCNHHGK